MEKKEDTSDYERSLLARLGTFLANRYASVDLRTLAAFRIAFGILLLRDLYDWTWGYNGLNFFTDLGVLPSYGVLKTGIHRPEWGLMFGVTSPGQLHVAVFVMSLVYFAYIVGWHTRVMQVLVILILLSLGHRDVLLQNGGVVAVNIIAVFTAFLPLGARFSLDALVRPPPPVQVVERPAYAFVTIELALIHGLNAAAKNGVTWRSGTAIHNLLWLNRFVTPLAGVLRMHEPRWFSPFFSMATLFVEWAIAFLILLPVAQRQARRLAILFIFGFHFAISRLMELGPFSYAMMCASILLLTTAEWDELDGRLPERLRTRLARAEAVLQSIVGPKQDIEPTPLELRLSGWGGRLRDTGALLIAVCCAIQICKENPVLPAPLHVEHPPPLITAIVQNLQIFQMWHMFSPDVFRSDGTLIVDGELHDGSHVDPFTGKPPDFEQAFHGPLDYGQPWCDYFWRLGGTELHNAYRPYLSDYLLRVHTLPWAKIHQRLKHFDVYWVSYDVPRMGSTEPREIKRKLLFSGDEPPPPPPKTPATSDSKGESQAATSNTKSGSPAATSDSKGESPAASSSSPRTAPPAPP
jgi:hypothetical protein